MRLAWVRSISRSMVGRMRIRRQRLLGRRACRARPGANCVVWAYLTFGALLGLSAGISPGPLLALVITQTLQHNTAEGIRVASVPLLTDLPIIILALLLFSSLPNPDFAIGLVSILGGLFVCYLGLSNLRQGPVELPLAGGKPRSYLKGLLVNALSPHPYLFWLGVGVPILIRAQQQHSMAAALGFVGAFYVCIVGAKVGVALLVGRSRDFLTGAAYLWAIRLMGMLLIIFALTLLYDGAVLTGLLDSA